MTRTLLFAIAIFIYVTSSAQKKEEFYDDGQLKSRGEVKKIKVKGDYVSMDLELKNGLWEYFYENGNKAKTENYSIRSKQQYSTGIWEYYAPDGRLIQKTVMGQGEPAMKIEDTGTFRWGPDYVEIMTFSGDSIYFRQSMEGFERNGLYVSGKIISYTTPLALNIFSNYKEVFKGLTLPDLSTLDEAKKFFSRIPPYEEYSLDTSRNLVLNADFSLSPGTEVQNGGIYKGQTAKHWHVAAGTPDYFTSIPWKRDGNAVMGFRVFTAIDNDIEYMQTELKHKLEKGKRYCLKFKLLLDQGDAFATAQVGARLDKNPVMIDGRARVITPAHIYNHKEVVYASSDTWMTWCSDFIASGDERILVIGSFQPLGKQKLYMLKDESDRQEAYYFVDDVSLTEINAEHGCFCYVPPAAQTDTLKVGDVVVLKNIFFETNKAILKDESVTELEKLLDLMENNPKMEIEISGHTDNTGTVKSNDELSQARANAVKKYLTDAGISASRIVSKGYGSRKPVDTNDTPEGKQNNRRVEFTVTGMRE